MTGDAGWASWIRDTAEQIHSQDRWRVPRTLSTGAKATTTADGRAVVEFASNDYLGLSQHPLVKAAACEAVERYGTGSGASRLVVGSRPVHDELERALATWKHSDAATVLPTGYAANLSALTTFADRDTLICSDELNHASIIDATRLSRAQVAVFRHGDVDHLAELLGVAGRRGRTARRVIVVSDTVFSMDGDLAPLDAIVEVCAEAGALLVLDEAHAVFGPDLVELPAGGIVLRVGTLSKTLGSLGGFVAGPRPAVDLIVNRARPYIFTTAPTPASMAAALAALQVVQAPEGARLLQRLRAHTDRLRSGHPSPIVPVVVGSESDALDLAGSLLQEGLLVPAIRPPTVPEGTSRLRIALSAAHDTSDLDRLVDALDRHRPTWRAGCARAEPPAASTGRSRWR